MTQTYTSLAFSFGGIGAFELIIIAVIALLIFGKRLPEVGKSLGKGIVEFKRGLHGIEDDVKSAGSTPQQQKPAGQIEGSKTESELNVEESTKQPTVEERNDRT